MEKVKQKILDVLGPFSKLWKGFEDIKNALHDNVAVSVECHIKLIEQTVLLLGQASTSSLHSLFFIFLFFFLFLSQQIPPVTNYKAIKNKINKTRQHRTKKVLANETTTTKNK